MIEMFVELILDDRLTHERVLFCDSGAQLERSVSEDDASCVSAGHETLWANEVARCNQVAAMFGAEAIYNHHQSDPCLDWSLGNELRFYCTDGAAS